MNGDAHMSGNWLNDDNHKTKKLKVRVSHLAIQDSPRRRVQKPKYLGHVCAVRQRNRREKFPGQSTAYLVGANHTAR